MYGTIDILIVEPGKLPKMKQILNSPEIFRRIVGGSYGIADFLDRDTIMVYRNRGAKLLERPGVFLQEEKSGNDGTVLLCGSDCTGFCSLPPSQQRYFANACRNAFPFVLLDSGNGQKIVCVTEGDLAKAACILWERLKTGDSVMLSKWAI